MTETKQNGYEMPPIAIGTIVLYYPGGVKNTEPMAAIVTRVAHRSVALSVISAENMNLMLRDGVRYLTDPELARDAVREDGAWDFTEDYKQVQKLLARGFYDSKKEKV